MPEIIHPSLPLFAAALLAMGINTMGQRIVLLVGAALSAVLVFLVPSGASTTIHVTGIALTPIALDALSGVFVTAFALYAVLASLFAWSDDSRMTRVFAGVLAGGGIGVALAGDLISMFVFWEMLAVSSLFLVWAGSDKQSGPAGFRYVIFHIVGGLCLLTGIIMHLQSGGENTLGAMKMDSAAAWLMLIGVLVNAAVPPLHAWLPDAYPRASIFGTVFLAAFTTKSAVYVLARLFPETEVLIWLGAVMSLYGVVFAVLENNIRRLLGYHIISQVGYMVCGVGIGTHLAINGSSAHAFSHIFYKGLLMMSAGAVVWATGRGKLSELGGLARPLRWVMVLFTIGALSIAGLPLLNGFISKSMVISAAAEAHHAPAEIMLIVASMGTFLSIGLKMLYLAFFGDRSEPTPVVRAVPRSMMLAMWLTALICLVTGVYPAPLYHALPHPVHYHPYTLDHVLTALQLLVGTALGFWLLRRVFTRKATITLDIDRLYRRPIGMTVANGSALLERTYGAIEQVLQAIAGAIGRIPKRLASADPLPLGLRVALIVIALVCLWFAS